MISMITQVSAQQAKPWSGFKIKLLSGLQMASHLSKATTARDHRLTIPGMIQKKLIKKYHKLIYLCPKVCLTTKCSQKTFDLACERSKDEISGCKGAAGSEGAHTGHEKVCHSQVELPLLDRAWNCKCTDGSAHSQYEKHEYGHCIECA